MLQDGEGLLPVLSAFYGVHQSIECNSHAYIIQEATTCSQQVNAEVLSPSLQQLN